MAPRRDPIREWRERFARATHSIDFKPISTGPFHAAVIPILAGVRTTLSPGFTFRDSELVKDRGGDAFSLIISRSKHLEVEQLGRDVRLCHGDATLLRVGETGRVGSHEDFEFSAQIIPYAEVHARGARLDAGVTKRISARSEAMQLLRGYMRSLETRKLQVSQEGRELVRRHLIDLVALAFTSQSRVGESVIGAVASARLNAALECIAERFEEPELSVAAVAHAQGISPRYLQRLIEQSGTSFTAQVNELRLQRAFALLRQSGEMRISDIALQVGFSDLSHFNRLFRSRFGDTPSAVRAVTPGAKADAPETS